MKNICPICKSIEQIKQNQNQFFVKELETGYVVICHHQYYKGYVLFFSKQHTRELHELDISFRKKYLFEMSLVAHTVYKAFQPVKLNYELLGNTAEHLHWHIIPRYQEDLNLHEPIWNTDLHIRNSRDSQPSEFELKALKKLFLKHWDEHIKLS